MGTKVPSERASCPRGMHGGAGEMGTDASWMSMENDQRCCAVCGESRTHGAKRVATQSRLCVCCASICEDTTQCSAIGTLPGHAIVVTRWCEVPGTMEPSSQDERQNREE